MDPFPLRWSGQRAEWRMCGGNDNTELSATGRTARQRAGMTVKHCAKWPTHKWNVEPLTPRVPTTPLRSRTTAAERQYPQHVQLWSVIGAKIRKKTRRQDGTVSHQAHPQFSNQNPPRPVRHDFSGDENDSKCTMSRPSQPKVGNGVRFIGCQRVVPHPRNTRNAT